MLVRQFYIFVVVFLCMQVNTKGQSVKDLFFDKPGLQVGMYQGYTQFNDAGVNYYFRLYNKHSFKPYRFGEFSISSGFISGLGYRSQLTPVEYRFGQHFSRLFNSPDPKMFGKRTNLYVYAGAGILYNKPLEVVAPDDPLTQEMGNTLPGTSFWDFQGGFAPFIPMGFGIELPLDAGANFNISAGYNQTLSMLKFNSHDVPKGYWGLSLGIDFKYNRPEPEPEPKPYTPPVMNTIKPEPIPPVKLEPQETNNMVLAKLNNRNVQFDLLSSHISDQDREWVEMVTKVFEFNPNEPLLMFGHASATGSSQVNQMISESRARAVWLTFIEAGVDLTHMDYSWYGDSRPVADNETDEGRAKNRRVLFTQTDSTIAISTLEGIERDLSYEFGESIFPTRYFQFSWLDYAEEENSLGRLQEVAALLQRDQNLNLFIATVSNQGYEKQIYRELDKARAEKIKADLIYMGVHYDALETFNPYEHELPSFVKEKLHPTYVQQVVLIPHNGLQIQLATYEKEENAHRFEEQFGEVLNIDFTIDKNEEAGTFIVYSPAYNTVSEAMKNLKEVQQISGLEKASIVPVSQTTNIQ